MFAAAACSSDSGSGGASASASAGTTNLTANEVQVSGTGAVMKVTFPFPASATELSSKDVVVGTGATAKLNDNITVNYYLAGGLTGNKIESSFDSGEPANFPLTEGGLIKGWTEGIPGMKVGGERILVVPGDLAYGANPTSPDIQPNETLIFVVQLTKIS